MICFPMQMFIEYCDGGALDSIIVDLEKGLTEKQVRQRHLQYHNDDDNNDDDQDCGVENQMKKHCFH